MKGRYIVALLVLLAFVFITGAAAGVVVDQQVLAPRQVAAGQAATGTGPNYSLIREAWAAIDKVYVDRTALDSQKLTYGAISGMVTALGDTGHSVFLTPDMLAEEHRQQEGSFEGIGAYVEMRNGLPTIVAPFDNSPAQKAGVKAGDVIVQVDGQDTSGQTLTQVVNRILGPAGTQVTLTLVDPITGETRDVTVTRARIQVVNVTWHMLPGTQIAHIRIVQFSSGVTKDLQAALSQAQQQGAQKIILDLRNNPGGLLDEAIGVASQFLPGDSVVMLQRDAKGNTEPLKTTSGAPATDLPMVVLINQGSASASEIVAGALHDNQRATLLGEKTFGTGTVLNEFKLSDGSALLLAVQEWLTPNGTSFWHKGIEPDVTVALDRNVSPLIPEEEKDLTAAQLQSSDDAQVLRAVQLLQEPGQTPTQPAPQ